MSRRFLVLATLVACSSATAEDTNQSQTFLRGDLRLKHIAGRVLGLDRQPLTNVEVLLREAPVGSQRSPDPYATEDLAVTTTDGDGRFSFRAIPTMRDRGQAKAFFVIAFARPTPKTSGIAVTWKRVADNTTDVTLVGRVPGKLHGVFRDGDGSPVVGASIRVKYLMSIRHITQADLEVGRWPSMSDGNFLALRSSTRGPTVKTNADGQFKFANLPANSGVILIASHPKFVQQMLFVSTSELDAQTKRLMKRRVQDTEVVGTFDSGHTVNVTVVFDDTGEIAKRAIHVQFNERAQRFDKTVLPDGTFQFTQVGQGQFVVSLSPPESKKTYLWGRSSLQLEGKSRTHDVTVRLPRAAILRGRFVHAATGAGLGEMSLTYTRLGPGPTSRVGIRSDKEGRFELKDRESSYRVFVRDSGRATMQVHDITTKIDAPTEIVFKVYPAPVYRGVVVDPDGKPVAGVTGKASYLSGENGIGQKHVTTDKDGRFELGGLFDQFYAERAMTIGDQTEVLFQDIDGGRAAIVMLDPPNGEPIPEMRVQLKTTGSISGRLIDAKTRQPIAGGTVSAAMHSRGISRQMMRRLGQRVETGKDGRFKLTGLIPGRKLEIAFGAKGFANGERTGESLVTEKNRFVTWPDLALARSAAPTPNVKPWPVIVPDVTGLSPTVALKKLLDAHRDSVAAYRIDRQRAQPKFGQAVGNSTWQFARRVMEVASEEPTSQTAFEAYMWSVKVREFTGGNKLFQLRRKACEQLVQHFVDREQLDDVVPSIVWSAGTDDVDEDPIPNPLAKRLINHSPHKHVQGLATYQTAQWILRRRGWVTSTDNERQLAIPLFRKCVKDYRDVEHFEGRATTLGVLSAAYIRDFTELAVGKKAPNIKGRLLNGEPFELADHRGEVVVLDFWSQGSWTVMSQLPDFEKRIAKEFDNKIVVYGVVEGAGPRIKNAADRFKFAWPIIHTGRGGGNLFHNWNVHTTPSAWVIDQRGIIRGKHLRAAEAANIAQNLIRNPPFNRSGEKK